jgi:hypothetical protein
MPSIMPHQGPTHCATARTIEPPPPTTAPSRHHTPRQRSSLLAVAVQPPRRTLVAADPRTWSHLLVSQLGPRPALVAEILVDCRPDATAHQQGRVHGARRKVSAPATGANRHAMGDSAGVWLGADVVGLERNRRIPLSRGRRRGRQYHDECAGTSGVRRPAGHPLGPGLRDQGGFRLEPAAPRDPCGRALSGALPDSPPVRRLLSRRVDGHPGLAVRRPRGVGSRMRLGWPTAAAPEPLIASGLSSPGGADHATREASQRAKSVAWVR